MAFFCQNCGKQLEEGAAFCSNCGTPAVIPPAQPEPVQPEPQPVPPQPMQYAQPAQYAQPVPPQPAQYPPAQPPYGPGPGPAPNASYTPAPQVQIPAEFAAKNAAQKKGKGGLIALILILLVAALGVVGYFGFREGGFFRSKPAVTSVDGETDKTKPAKTTEPTTDETTAATQAPTTTTEAPTTTTAEQSAPTEPDLPDDRTAALSQLEEDKALLEEKGYTVSVLASDLEGFETALGAESGSLVRYLSAVNGDGEQLIVYYFKTAEEAAACAGEYYVHDGYRIIYGNAKALVGGKNRLEWKGTFNGTQLPQPRTDGRITEWTIKEDAVTIRIDGMSYEEYVAYCEELEALPGWEVENGEDTAHFPEDYNDRYKTDFSGKYGNIPYISVQYYSDKTCEGTGYPHFCMFVFSEY